MLGFGQNEWWSRQLAQRTKTKISLPKIPLKTNQSVEKLGKENFAKRIFHYGTSVSPTPPKKLLPGRLKKPVQTSENREVKREIRAWAVPTFSLLTPRNVTLPTQRKPPVPPAPGQSLPSKSLLKSPRTHLSPIRKFKSLSPKLQQRESRSLSPIECSRSEKIRNNYKLYNSKSPVAEPKVIQTKIKEAQFDNDGYQQNTIRKYATYIILLLIYQQQNLFSLKILGIRRELFSVKVQKSMSYFPASSFVFVI
jgi:hypothetical protein